MAAQNRNTSSTTHSIHTVKTTNILTYDINSDYDDFVEVSSRESKNGIFTFLLDSGADISLIKVNTLSPHVSISKSEIINMRGFARGMISSIGVAFKN